MTVTELFEARIASGRLEDDPAQRAALVPLERIHAKLLESPRRDWLGRRKPPEDPMGAYLWGGVGRGKSMLMDLFHEAAPVPSRRVHFHAFMQEAHEAMHAARAAGTRDALAPFADGVVEAVRLLCLDEMQVGDITDAMVVGRLFERLWEGGVHVVTTSNRVPGDLYKEGLNRALFVPFIEAIERRMLVHELAAARDYRRDRLAGARRYFTPETTDDMDLEDLWNRLSDGRSEGLTLRVKGRDLRLDDYSAGVARARFETLCGRPLGAGDYLALAGAVRVLVLTHVPRLEGRHHNEARRFVTLIDALYEAGTELIVSAAAEPEDLYGEGRGRFEFDRTASRLREMRSEGWPPEKG
ncbi:cell division protein ZapE [Jannaschia sp. W003]|uniref:cell division protein ZapE n=1 Tax=Jannaschia sp. W003 TaxID=2867012 RepID=UPI0021A6D009|nr:cell division protein ZapE [Jannaschia sp. W003]UWQ21895.1 AFG1 family ATPase [Jannaschia sp. W003]